MPLFSTIPCPSCASPVGLSVDIDRVTVDHQQPYGPHCETELRRLMDEMAGGNPYVAVFPRDN